MKVVICGAGQVGANIAKYLAHEGNDVTIVDVDPHLVRDITDQLDVQGVAGFASHPNVLEQAGLRDADLLIAVTHSDEVNADRLPGRACDLRRADQDRPGAGAILISNPSGRASSDPTIWASMP
jgi:2-polyprenyl-6-methoxyphenol hydroxylase-like FAD-dependent oxidoreductase